MDQLKICTMCEFSTQRQSTLVDHIFSIHRDDPHFLIYCSRCYRSYTKWDSYRKHVYRGNCKNIEDGSDTGNEGSQPMSVDSDDNDLSAQEADDGGSGADEQQVADTWHAAVFILSIKEQHMLTQAAVDRVISSTSTLISRLNRGIVQDLEQAYGGVVPDSIMSDITSRVQRTESIFSGISTAYEQKKFFKETFNVVVSVNMLTM